MKIEMRILGNNDKTCKEIIFLVVSILGVFFFHLLQVLSFIKMFSFEVEQYN